MSNVDWSKSFLKKEPFIDSAVEKVKNKVDWASSFKEEKSPDFTSIKDVIGKLEWKGEKGKTAETNNIGNVFHTNELAQKYNAVRGPKLPEKINPDNRELYTAQFPNKKDGDNATMDVIKNIYNTSEGDIEKFASIYSMGLLPNQLITKEQNQIKDRYVKALTPYWETEDISKTITRKQNDVTQAVIDETLRLQDGKNILETDLENNNLFDITRIRELGSLQNTRDVNVVTDYNDKVITDYKGFQKEISPFAISESTGVVNNFISQFENQDTVYIGKSREFYNVLNEYNLPQKTKHVNDERPLYEINPNNPTLIEKKINEISQSGSREFNLTQAPPTISDLKKQGVPWAQAYRQVVGSNAPEGSLKRGLDNFLPSLQETFVGLGDFAQRLGEFAISGKGGEQLWEDIVMGWKQTPYIINDAILATVPLPYASIEGIGPEKVAQAKKNFAESPVPYIMSAMYLNPKAYITLDVASKGALNLAKKKAQTISSNAIKLIDKTPEQIAQYDKNTQAMVRHFQENPQVIPTVVENVTGKKAKDLVEINQFLSKDTNVKSQGFKERQIETAQKEVAKVSESLAEVEQTLLRIKEGEIQATPLQIESLNKSRQKSITLIAKNVDIIGQDAFVSNLQGGFGLFKPDAKKFASYVKNVYNGVGSEILDSKILTTIMGTSRPQDWIDAGKARTKSQKDLAEAMVSNAEANSTRKAENSQTLKSFKNELGKKFVDISFVTDSFLEKIEKSSDPELGKLNQIDNDVYRNLNPTERQALDNYIIARNERDLKRYQDEKVISLTEEKKSSPNEERLKEIDAELKRIKNYDYAQDGRYLTSKNLDKDFRVITPLSDDSFAKIKQSANLYFAEMRVMVDDLFDNNLITKQEADDLKARDYEPKQYIDKMSGKQEYLIKDKRRITYDNGYELKEGDKGALYSDSEGLMRMSITSAVNRKFKNDANLSLSNLIKETEGTDFALGYEITKKKPLKKGYVEISYRDTDASVKKLALEENFAEGWVTKDPKVLPLEKSFYGWVSGTKVLKASATGYNPIFAVTNIVRDAQYIPSARDKLYNNFLPFGGIQFLNDFAKSFPDYVRGSLYGTSKNYRDWINEGGATSLLTRNGEFGFLKSVRFDKGLKVLGKDVAQALKWTLGVAGEASEVTTRLAVRRRALLNGMSPKDATFLSRSYLDFSRAGSYGRSMDTVIPYFATSIQATRGYAKAFKNNKVQLAQKTAQLFAIEHLLQENYYGSEEGREIYRRIKPYDMYNNFVIPISYKHIDNNGQKFPTSLFIPKDNIQKIVSTSYAKLKSSYHGNPFYFDNSEFLENTLQNLSPLEFSSLAPIVHVALALGANTDLYGRKIYKGQIVPTLKDETNRSKVPEQLWIKDIANIAPIDMSPARLQYSINRTVAKGNPFWNTLQNNYSDLRKNLDPETIDYMDEYVSNKIKAIPGLNTLVNKHIKPVEPYDWYENKEIQNATKQKNLIREQNKEQVDLFFIRFKNAKTEKKRKELYSDYINWTNTTLIQRYGEEEFKFIANYYKEISELKISKINEKFYKRLQSDKPIMRAYRLAGHVLTEGMTEKEEIEFISQFKNLKGFKDKKFWAKYTVISKITRDYGRGEGLKTAKRLMNVEEE